MKKFAAFLLVIMAVMTMSSCKDSKEENKIGQFVTLKIEKANGISLFGKEIEATKEKRGE